jgi:hypothetical protein
MHTLISFEIRPSTPEPRYFQGKKDCPIEALTSTGNFDRGCANFGAAIPSMPRRRPLEFKRCM